MRTCFHFPAGGVRACRVYLAMGLWLSKPRLQLSWTVVSPMFLTTTPPGGPGGPASGGQSTGSQNSAAPNLNQSPSGGLGLVQYPEVDSRGRTKHAWGGRARNGDSSEWQVRSGMLEGCVPGWRGSQRPSCRDVYGSQSLPPPGFENCWPQQSSPALGRGLLKLWLWRRNILFRTFKKPWDKFGSGSGDLEALLSQKPFPHNFLGEEGS